LGPCTQGFGVEVHVARVEHEDLQACCSRQGGEQLVVPPGGLHGQRRTVWQLMQPGADGASFIGDAATSCLIMEGGHQLGLGHIHTDKRIELLHDSLLRERMTSVGVDIPASRVGLLKDRRYAVPLSSLSTLEGGVGAIFASRSEPIAGTSRPSTPTPQPYKPDPRCAWIEAPRSGRLINARQVSLAPGWPAAGTPALHPPDRTGTVRR